MKRRDFIKHVPSVGLGVFGVSAFVQASNTVPKESTIQPIKSIYRALVELEEHLNLEIRKYLNNLGYQTIEFDLNNPQLLDTYHRHTRSLDYKWGGFHESCSFTEYVSYLSSKDLEEFSQITKNLTTGVLSVLQRCLVDDTPTTKPVFVHAIPKLNPRTANNVPMTDPKTGQKVTLLGFNDDGYIDVKLFWDCPDNQWVKYSKTGWERDDSAPLKWRPKLP